MTKQLEWSELWDAMKAAPDAWISTTANMYLQMLECVQPRADAGNRFLVGEAELHNEEGKAVHACFKRVDHEVFAKYMTVDQFFGGAK